MSSEIDETLRKIKEGFNNVVYPGNENIAIAPGEMYLQEYRDIVQPFLGKQQQSITIKFALENKDALYYFTPDAFQYYLPAFMRIVLSYPKPEESDVLPEILISILAVPSDPDDLPSFYNKMRHFTKGQKNAIAAFLDLCFILFPDVIEIIISKERFAITQQFWQSS